MKQQYVGLGTLYWRASAHWNMLASSFISFSMYRNQHHGIHKCVSWHRYGYLRDNHFNWIASESIHFKKTRSSGHNNACPSIGRDRFPIAPTRFLRETVSSEFFPNRTEMVNGCRRSQSILFRCGTRSGLYTEVRDRRTTKQKHQQITKTFHEKLLLFWI